jgi:hypothetical protein
MSDDLKSQFAISKPPFRAEDISKRIHTIRGHRVMLDTDLAELYRVTRRVLGLEVTNCDLKFMGWILILLRTGHGSKYGRERQCDRLFDGLSH